VEEDSVHSRLRITFALAALLLGVSNSAPSQDLDGPTHVFRDPLLDNMVGTWNLAGNVVGRPATHLVEAEWVLNHQFLRIHEKDQTPAANGSVPYEAIIMVGYDNASDRYVVHWNDIYGGRFSETLGYGTRSGDEIRLVFEYPDGPFHTTFRWLPDAHRWNWHMQSKDKTGNWKDFADLNLTRAEHP
jgi:hypothetical protein